MKYFRARGKFLFFGEEFIKGELITETELKKWVLKQLKQGAGDSTIKNFIIKEFETVILQKAKTFFLFGARFQEEDNIF